MFQERQEFKETLFFINSPPDNPKRIDFVLVYKDSEDKDDAVRKEKRETFLANLEEEGLEIEIEDKSVSIVFLVCHFLVRGRDKR